MASVQYEIEEPCYISSLLRGGPIVVQEIPTWWKNASWIRNILSIYKLQEYGIYIYSYSYIIIFQSLPKMGTLNVNWGGISSINVARATASTCSMARTITDHWNPLRSPADGHLSIRPGKLALWFPESTACPPTSLLIKQPWCLVSTAKFPLT